MISENLNHFGNLKRTLYSVLHKQYRHITIAGHCHRFSHANSLALQSQILISGYHTCMYVCMFWLYTYIRVIVTYLFTRFWHFWGCPGSATSSTGALAISANNYLVPSATWDQAAGSLVQRYRYRYRYRYTCDFWETYGCRPSKRES